MLFLWKAQVTEAAPFQPGAMPNMHLYPDAAPLCFAAQVKRRSLDCPQSESPLQRAAHRRGGNNVLWSRNGSARATSAVAVGGSARLAAGCVAGGQHSSPSWAALGQSGWGCSLVGRWCGVGQWAVPNSGLQADRRSLAG